MKRKEVIQVDQLKDELSNAFRSFEQSLKTVFGELVYGIDTVIERYNTLEARLDVITARLLALEQRRDTEH